MRIPNIRTHESPQPPSSKEKFSLSPEYHILKEIGHGAFAKVYKAVEMKTNKKVAIKRFDQVFEQAQLAQHCLREIAVLSRASHPNIVRMHRIMRSQSSVFIVMDYSPSDLRGLIHSPTYFDHTQIKRVMYEILLSLNYLHSARVVHRDIKPGNILVSKDYHVQLCDFGLARSIDGLKISTYDFDKVYRKEFAVSNEQNTVVRVTDSSDNNEDLAEDLDEHVKINVARSIQGHFGEGVDRSKLSPTITPISKPSADELDMAGYMRKSSCDVGKEEKKAVITLCPRSVSLRRKEFVESLHPDPHMERELTSHVASRWYRAPEIILLEKVYSTAVDIWSLGCVFAELLQMVNGNRAGYKDRRPLFPGSSCFPLSPQMKPGNGGEIEHFQPGDQLMTICKVLGSQSGSSTDFVGDYGAKHYLHMLPVCERTEWIDLYPACTEEELDLLEKMLTFNPFLRITTKEALRHPYFAAVRCREREIEGVPTPAGMDVPRECAIERLQKMCDQ